MDSFKTMPETTQRQVHSDTVYSDPASENRNRYARAKNEPSKHTLRRERRDQADRARHLIHLSDMETSDSTRLSIDRKALQDQLRAATPRTIASRLATVTPQRQAFTTDADRFTQHLLAPPSAFTTTGARPKQVQGQSPAPPRITTAEKINSTTTERDHSTGASNSSPDTPAGSAHHLRFP